MDEPARAGVGAWAWVIIGVIIAVALLSAGAAGGREPDPALINPTLEVARNRADGTRAAMTYWPSYSSVQPV